MVGAPFILPLSIMSTGSHSAAMALASLVLVLIPLFAYLRVVKLDDGGDRPAARVGRARRPAKPQDPVAAAAATEASR